MATPERANTWMNMVLPVLERGGPVTTLVLGLCALAMIWGLYREMNRLHATNRELAERLLATNAEQLNWVRTLVHCAPAAER